MRPSELYDMDVNELSALMEYHKKRPWGMYEDIRTYKLMQVSSMVEKMPPIESIFQNLGAIVKETRDSEEAQRKKMQANKFLGMLQAKAQDQDPEIMKWD